MKGVVEAMNEYGSSYVPVEANSVMPMNEDPSGPDGGWSATGQYVNWDSNNGVTGQGWDDLIGAPCSPFAGMNATAIKEAIERNGNLDSYFRQLANYEPSEQSAFLRHLEDKYGYTNQGGCIGDRLYS